MIHRPSSLWILDIYDINFGKPASGAEDSRLRTGTAPNWRAPSPSISYITPLRQHASTDPTTRILPGFANLQTSPRSPPHLTPPQPKDMTPQTTRVPQDIRLAREEPVLALNQPSGRGASRRILSSCTIGSCPASTPNNSTLYWVKEHHSITWYFLVQKICHLF